MRIEGAGGTRGGVGRFFVGLAMMIAGSYLFFNAIQVTHFFGMGYGLFRFGGVSVTTGMVLVPLIFGIGFIFYNARNPLGWVLSIASLIMLSFGVITGLNFSLRPMSAFDLITILVLFIGGIGLFLSALRNQGEGKAVR